MQGQVSAIFEKMAARPQDLWFKNFKVLMWDVVTKQLQKNSFQPIFSPQRPFSQVVGVVGFGRLSQKWVFRYITSDHELCSVGGLLGRIARDTSIIAAMPRAYTRNGQNARVRVLNISNVDIV